jgi:hypothetical protein
MGWSSGLVLLALVVILAPGAFGWLQVQVFQAGTSVLDLFQCYKNI